MGRLCLSSCVLPSGGNTQVVVAVVVPVVVDVETLPIEVANIDAVAVRVHDVCLPPSNSPEVEVCVCK